MVFTTDRNWIREIPKIKQLGSEGYTISKVAKEYNVTRQRMQQLVAQYIPEWNYTYGRVVLRRKKAEEWYG